MTWGYDVAKSSAQPTQGGAGQPGFGINEIMLSTCVMLSR
jgi:hypothetical protein